MQLGEKLLLEVRVFKAQRAELLAREEGLLHPTDRDGLQCGSGTATTRRRADRALNPVQLLGERAEGLLEVQELLHGILVRGVGEVRARHRM